MVLVMVALMVLGVGAGLYGVVRLMVGYQAYVVPGEAMAPTLLPESRIVVRDRGGEDVHRGDVVLIDSGAFASREFEGPTVARVVGVAGDTVACCTERHLSIGGKPITEPYVNPGDDGLFEFSAKVPEGTVFVEGDNRGNSDDSRFRGPAQLSGVTGFVVATGTVITPKPLPAVTAFTDAGLPGAPFTDSPLSTLRWWIAGGFVLFVAGFIGLIVTLVRSAGRRRKAAAVPPVH